MNWMVTSSIHGGTQYAPATRERYTAAVASLRNQAKEMKGAGFFWSVAHDQLRKDRAGAAFCPALAGSGGDGEPGHVSMPYARLLEQCVTHARECATLAGDLEQVADLIARAHSLYDEAETKAAAQRRMEHAGDAVALRIRLGLHQGRQAQPRAGARCHVENG